MPFHDIANLSEELQTLAEVAAGDLFKGKLTEELESEISELVANLQRLVTKETTPQTL